MGAALLICDSCRRTHGSYETYEAWEDAARKARWFVGEDLVLCDRCAEPDDLSR